MQERETWAVEKKVVSFSPHPSPFLSLGVMLYSMQVNEHLQSGGIKLKP